MSRSTTVCRSAPAITGYVLSGVLAAFAGIVIVGYYQLAPATMRELPAYCEASGAQVAPPAATTA
ncbi:hypothetical protein [Herbiconiux sp. YIM B11900]|uniref:hypothetical protein n=1 Tax=Herbiconiux sp. YIM B11900 TaxID=3404131 RepID=UPI003F83C424